MDVLGSKGESLGRMCPLRKVRTNRLRSNPVEKQPGVLVDDEVNPSQPCALAADSSLDCFKGSDYSPLFCTH